MNNIKGYYCKKIKKNLKKNYYSAPNFKIIISSTRMYLFCERIIFQRID